MTAPRRLVEDPDADSTLRDVLESASTRPLDAVTRRRLGAKVARASALPVATAGWLFVKSATAALGVVLGTGAIAVSAGIIEWGPSVERTAVTPSAPARAHAPSSAFALTPPAPEPEPERPVPVAEPPAPQLNPTPTLPLDSSGSTRLSEEAALLESARAKLRLAPADALALARLHAVRFPRGQLGSERALIQIDALHRLGRDSEARAVSRELLGGPGAGLYTERVRQLLGEPAER